MTVTATVNGQPVAITVDVRRTLLDLLREDLGLTGTKKGCDHGQCGACTVFVDGRRVLSCLKLAVTTSGQAVTTVEGLGTPDVLHPLQEAFMRYDAFQCGYCTSGQLMSALAVVADESLTTRDQIREAMSGNLCRCGAYQGIVEAIIEVKARSHAAGSEDATPDAIV
ncbi:(2Fe-2S)-binding protein [Microvirga brassicacearum]|uniref:(2Fe-2S)-binding protein n=1 Tax=Microvirga brassicacearum TaxID=2580413 RepID=A0A5N3PE72_9HYPH|nr:(2Fe-2S)-binding protein [Microvirga brassicacearum]KAB0268038.1 (2Fe-2S)-binding protein [Microvirga brassicacearum]